AAAADAADDVATIDELVRAHCNRGEVRIDGDDAGVVAQEYDVAVAGHRAGVGDAALAHGPDVAALGRRDVDALVDVRPPAEEPQAIGRGHLSADRPLRQRAAGQSGDER